MNAIIEEASMHGEVLRSCFGKYFDGNGETLAAIKKTFDEEGLNRVIFAGVGSSYYAPFSVSGLLNGEGISASVYNASDLSLNNFNQITEKTLLVCISSSGSTKEIVELARMAKGIGRIVGIFNKEGSPLDEIADYSLLLHLGSGSVVANKPFLCMVAVLNVLAHALVGKLNDDFKAECYKAVEWIENWHKNYETNTQPLYALAKDARMFDFLADGEGVATINQTAMVMREFPKVYTAAKECADYAHGWYGCVRPGYLGFIFAPSYQEGSTAKRMADQALDRGGKIILFTGSQVEAKEGMAVVSLPKLRKSLIPLMEVIPCGTLMGMMVGSDSKKN
jgi:glucosamine--fructose-6-phosphate aminotransferase (isomerizing)